SAPGQVQVIVQGRVHGDVKSSARSEQEYLTFSLQIIAESLHLLRSEYEIIVLEGAGSPAEINLINQDVANMKAAHLAEAPVLLVSDIDRGGALAAAVGTMMLLPEQDRQRVAGFVMNKFRGDLALLEPGLALVEERTGVPVYGVVPYLEEAYLAEEDGVALDYAQHNSVHEEGCVRIYVIHLPHISNFTDFAALSAEDDVTLIYTNDAADLHEADAIIIPGTKNSMRDLLFLHELGLDKAIKQQAKRGIPVVGICGGYQMLGTLLQDPQGSEFGGEPTTLAGLGLVATTTIFHQQKKVVRVQAKAQLTFARGLEVEGYEIHMGQTERAAGCEAAFMLDGELLEGACSVNGNVWGTYLHGVFDRPGFRRAWLNLLRERRGWQPLGAEAIQDRAQRFDALADAVQEALDMPALYRLLGLSGPKEEKA
ncbi:MAG: cobyric acid synthase, partial [Firmicutes bacterium]|nr:cobyric acid synthase [Bacillota bacterium]